MPTQLDNTWLPEQEHIINSDIRSWYNNTTPVSKEVGVLLEKISDRIYRWLESVPVFKILQDHHSSLSSDDLLWYMQHMTPAELSILKEIKIKGNDLIIPRELSREIELAIQIFPKSKK